MAGVASQQRAQRRYDQRCGGSITRKLQFIYNFGCSKVNRHLRVEERCENVGLSRKSGAGRRRVGQPCDEGAALRSALPIKKACRTGSVHSQHKLIATAQSIPQKLQTGYNLWRIRCALATKVRTTQPSIRSAASPQPARETVSAHHRTQRQ